MSGLSLTVLGCSGSYPGPGAACSGYLVQGGGVNVVVDLGPGSLANLQHHLPLDAIDAVVLSHGHPDHWVDLTGLEVARRYVLRAPTLPVYGTAHNRGLAAALLGELEPTFAWHEVADGGHVTIGGLTLDFSATDHYVDTLAVRIAGEGRVLAYSADTGPGWSFAEFARVATDDPIDLGLCEATMLADAEGETMHLSARQAGAMAREAGVDRLVLTHLQPGTDRHAAHDEGAAAFGRSVSVAAEHLRYDV